MSVWQDKNRQYSVNDSGSQTECYFTCLSAVIAHVGLDSATPVSSPKFLGLTDIPPLEVFSEQAVNKFGIKFNDEDIDKEISRRKLTKSDIGLVELGSFVYLGKYQEEMVALKLIQRYDKQLSRMVNIKHNNLIEYKMILDDILFSAVPSKLLVLELFDTNLYDIIYTQFDPQLKSRTEWHDCGKKIALDIISGLEYMHQNDMVHKAIRSPNIMMKLTNDPQVPFIAKLGTLDTVSQTKFKNIPRWISPELPTIPASDVYSFGVVLWEIASGEEPWKGKDQIDTLFSEIKSGNFFSQHSKKCPETDLLVLIERCTFLDPEKRLTAPLVKKELSAIIKN